MKWLKKLFFEDNWSFSQVLLYVVFLEMVENASDIIVIIVLVVLLGLFSIFLKLFGRWVLE